MASAAMVIGAAVVSPLGALASRPGTAFLDQAITSPQPFFMQLSGQGPTFIDHRIAWTAINPQGQAGSQADRIYLYDLQRHSLTVPVRTHYGKAGFIGGYALADNALAYVDTGITPGGLLSWQVNVVDLRSGDEERIAASPPGGGSHIAPQIAYNGSYLLLLQTVDTGATSHESVVTLFSPALHHNRVLERLRDHVVGDPALAHGAALWTTISFAPHASSRLTEYNMARHTLRTVPVGDVSQLSASGDLVVWKSGMSGVNGHIGLFNVRSDRVVATDLAHADNAIYPTTDGNVVAWTYGDGSRVQVYSLRAGRVIFSTPAVNHHYYGLTAVSNHTVSWTVTTVGSGRSGARGYVVVHQL